ADQGQLSKATHTIEDAIAEQRRVQEAYDLPLYLEQKAGIEAKLGHLRSADVIYYQATHLIEAMLVNAPSSLVKSSMIATMSDVYVSHFRLAVTEFHNSAKAFAVLESARGRSLADSLRYSSSVPHFRTPSSPPEQEISRIQKLMRDTIMSPEQGGRLVAKLDDAYNQLTPVEYQRNRDEMKKLYRPVSLSRVERSLRSDETLIEYVLDPHRNSYALELTQQSVRVHELPSREQIDKLVRAYITAIKEKNDWAPLAKNLYAQVLAPAISGHPNAINIVPDGSLHLVPFAALIGAGNQYAVSSMTIASAPSATVLYILRTAAKLAPASRPFLALAYSADSQEPDASESMAHTGGVFDGQRLKLAPLPYALQEVTTAAEIFGKKSILLTGDRASEAALKAEPLNDFKIIHIAAHGVGNITEPDRAGFVLAPGSETEDGFWQAREIRRSTLSADLVTLSACETGVGRLEGEEGIMNLARAFLVAGAKSVLASLWEADDRFTATLMEHFYRHIAEGLGIAEALRTAQSEMLFTFGKDAQPYYWAGFTVIGDGTRKVSLQTDDTHVTAARKNIRQNGP
ncbi:MAG: CHAT domain-containing protein, partial [Acidobacteriaceae bacterium]|nr:CHAT domain-containing protein [Acidobacteriaceae bacterium]